VVAALFLLGSVVTSELARGLRPAAWLLELGVVLAGTAGVARLRARQRPSGLQATGPVGHEVNAAVFAALYAIPWYAPALGFTGDAACCSTGRPCSWPRSAAVPV
jgi:hypothetical protein